jgi:hypothetical protein
MKHQDIHRSVAQMAFQVTQNMEAKRKLTDDYRLREVELQYQFDIAGKATAIPSWNEVSVTFDEVLYDAPGQRDSDNDEPQVWIGKVLDTDAPIMIDAHVSDWDINEEGHTTGVTVRVGVFDLAQTDPNGTPFAGRLHVTVQGLGAPDDQEGTDGDDGEEA